MTRLPQIQDAFQGYLLRGDDAVEALVVGTERVPIATRLSIYGDGYCSRLIEAQIGRASCRERVFLSV